MSGIQFINKNKFFKKKKIFIFLKDKSDFLKDEFWCFFEK